MQSKSSSRSLLAVNNLDTRGRRQGRQPLNRTVLEISCIAKWLLAPSRWCGVTGSTGWWLAGWMEWFPQFVAADGIICGSWFSLMWFWKLGHQCAWADALLTVALKRSSKKGNQQATMSSRKVCDLAGMSSVSSNRFYDSKGKLIFAPVKHGPWYKEIMTNLRYPAWFAGSHLYNNNIYTHTYISSSSSRSSRSRSSRRRRSNRVVVIGVVIIGVVVIGVVVIGVVVIGVVVIGVIVIGVGVGVGVRVGVAVAAVAAAAVVVVVE